MTGPVEPTRFMVNRPVHEVWARMLADGDIPDRGITLTDDQLGVLHTCPVGDDGTEHLVDLDAAIAVVFPPADPAEPHLTATEGASE